MKGINVLVACVLLSSALLSPAEAQNSSSSNNDDNLAAEVKALREVLLQTRQQLAAQEREIEALKANSRNHEGGSARNELTSEGGTNAPHDWISPSVDPTAASAAEKIDQAPAEPAQQTREPQDPPLGSIKLGDAILDLGGFVDFENIFRTTNTQANIATPFGSIPYNNTPQGRVSELRTTAQFSRLSVKVTNKFRGNDLTAYVEGDFSGNDAPSVYQSVNGHTNRLRLYFVDFRRGRWEFLGGQTWSWLTANRTGIGPMPVDLAITYNEDQNLGVGVPYTRAAEFRIAYHPNEHWAFGVGIEDPNQFIGSYVALPSTFTSIDSQFDNGAQIGAPNAFPDILSKITYDTNFARRHFHAEVAGLLNGAHATVKPVGQDSFRTHTVVGGGGQIAANYELTPKLTLLANAFWSSGGAHYLVATGPQLVVRPNATGTDVSLSMVHAGAGSAGLEWKASEKDAFAFYYGADYFGRNSFPDTTDSAHPGTVIGFGGSGSPNTNNRAIQQLTFDWLQRFWKNRKYGALQFYTQYSYLTRVPWFVGPGTPKNAHLSMVYCGFRYILPTTSGTLLRVPYPN